MEAFKPGHVPEGAVIVEGEAPEGAEQQGEAFPEYPDNAQAGGPPQGFPPPQQYRAPPPGRSGFQGPPSNDRALTSGTGGLY
jgi:hypothetical protein